MQNGGCEGKRLEGGCLERKDFSQDSFSTTNLPIFWANKRSEHRRFIFKRHWSLIPLLERIGTPALGNITFPTISIITFRCILSEEKGRSKREELFPSQPTDLFQVSFARRYFSFRKCFYDINGKNDWELFYIHPSWLFLATVKIKPIIKTRYCDILEIQAPGKLQIY